MKMFCFLSWQIHFLYSTKYKSSKLAFVAQDEVNVDGKNGALLGVQAQKVQKPHLCVSLKNS